MIEDEGRTEEQNEVVLPPALNISGRFDSMLIDDTEDEDDSPSCEYCAKGLVEFDTFAYAPYCSAECRDAAQALTEDVEHDTVWELQHGHEDFAIEHGADE